MRRTKRWLALLLCGAVAIGGASWQLISAVAVGECTCEIEVHGSNCPLSNCSCQGKTTGVHDESCSLYSLNSDLTKCVCEPNVHAAGCARYESQRTTLQSVSEEAGAEDTATDEAETESSAAAESSDSSDVSEGTDQTDENETSGDSTDSSSDAESTTGSADASDTQGSTDTSSGSTGGSDSETGSSSESSQSGSSASETDASDSDEDGGEPAGEATEEDVPEDPDEEEDASWDYPSGWYGYGEGRMEGNILVAANYYELDLLLDDHIETIQGYLTNGENAEILEDEDNYGDIVAVYAVLSGQSDDYPYNVILDDEDDVELFYSVYWSMTQVTGLSNASGAAISVRRLSVDDALELYDFDDDEETLVKQLAEESDTVDSVVQESIFSVLTTEEFEELLSLVPDDISAERRAVLLTAAALDGRVSYFWGGKSVAYGWDDRWGELRTVTSAGSSSYGTTLPLGLDCSGFVRWAFINVYGEDGFTALSTATQWQASDAVAWSDAQPGDLVFYYVPGTTETNHVGIVLTVNEDGPELVVHCSSAGVNISGAGNFSYVRRPAVYGSD